MTPTVAELARAYGEDFAWFDFQVDVFDAWQGWGRKTSGLVPLDKMCVYYPTGKGKTRIMLACMRLRGITHVVIIAPPITAGKWEADAAVLGMTVEVMSHAKFRMPTTKLSRHEAVIVDEFHLLGGHDGKGWKKLDTMARHLKAALIIGSATPNYNDAERVYCVAHVLDPMAHRGGYLSWIFQHCTTEANNFGRMPIVTGFQKYPDAASMLADLPGVVYLPDDAPDIVRDLPIHTPLPDEFDTLNLDRHRHRIMASQMEKKHRRRYLHIVDPDTGRVRDHVYDELISIAGSTGKPILIFAEHASIARALRENLIDNKVSFSYVDGDTSNRNKQLEVARFLAGETDVLVGTASMATGTDGVDKVADVMVILDDTYDHSLRRQLVGRVLPRGVGTPDYSAKRAIRFVYSG